MRKYLITNHDTKERYIVEANSAQEAAQQVGYRIKEVSPIDIGQPKLSGIPISKAIERLAIIEELMATDFSPEDRDAVKLGIEGLERFRLERQRPDCIGFDLLPSETPEN